MNNTYLFLAYFVLLFLLMGLYFKLAEKFNIIDRPNERSSHTLVTVRGGGILFPVSALIFPLFFDFPNYSFLIGLTLVSLVSFVDDVRELNWSTRIVVQFIAIILLFHEQALLLEIPVYLSLPLIVLTVAMVNAWNFMDGINGITGGYSLLTLLSLLYINDQVESFGSSGFMITVGLSLLVFIFFNFRTHARCFAGDVGSISIAFILAFLIIQLITTSGNFNYILFMLLYGLDTVTTIVFRAIRKEPILQPHRSHFFQFLANEKNLSHNTVSLLYIAVQLVINVIVLLLPDSSVVFVGFLVLSTTLFILLRFAMEGKHRLLSRAADL